MGAATQKGLHIELEDYLYGICSLPNELVTLSSFSLNFPYFFLEFSSDSSNWWVQSRLCVNSVTASNFELPLKINAFVSDIYAGFRLLNLKNDGLRKKYDGMKWVFLEIKKIKMKRYDMKKIEEVVYDISIRKLAPSTAMQT